MHQYFLLLVLVGRDLFTLFIILWLLSTYRVTVYYYYIGFGLLIYTSLAFVAQNGMCLSAAFSLNFLPQCWQRINYSVFKFAMAAYSFGVSLTLLPAFIAARNASDYYFHFGFGLFYFPTFLISDFEPPPLSFLPFYYTKA